MADQPTPAGSATPIQEGDIVGLTREQHERAGTYLPLEAAIARDVIERAVQDGFFAARKRWHEKLREYDGDLDGLDAWAVEVTAITDSVMSAIAAASEPAE